MNVITEPAPTFFVEPSIENPLGPKSKEISGWIKEYSVLFLNQFGELSLQKLNGIGWQEISESPNGQLCKADFGINKASPIDISQYRKDIFAGKLQFTGKGLCAYSTYLVGSAIAEKYPEADLKWVELYTDLTETTKPDEIWPERHQVLEVSFPGEKPFVIDLTYGQVNHTQRVLIKPTAEINQNYPDEKRVELTKLDFQEESNRFIEQIRGRKFLNPISEKDLTVLKSIFDQIVIPLAE